MDARERPPSTIAVLHLNQVGDLVFSLPALAALREGFPGARVVSVLRQNLAPLLSGSGLVDEAVGHRGVGDFFRTAEVLRLRDIDLAVCLSESPRSRLLAYLSRAPRRAGLDDGPLASLLTERVEKHGLPSTSNNIRLVQALGCPVPQDNYVGLLDVARQDRQGAIDLLRERGLPERQRLVLLAPGASPGQQHKEWPLDRFVEVARQVGAIDGVVAVFVGTELRDGSAEEPPGGCFDLSGQTSLTELAGLLSLADLFVGNDSGALHLAACLAVPCVALFGPTDPDETGPQGEGHIVLRADASGSIESIPTVRVLEAIERQLAERALS